MSDATADVIEVVAAVLNIPPARLSAEASMDTLEEWDSLAQLQICMRFEERFKVDLDMETIAEATSVAALSQLLRN